MRVRPRLNGKLISLRVAEAEYGIPYGRLYEWVRSGKLPHLDDGIRSYFLRRSDLEKFIASNMTDRH
jgi:excisionase family DNA binding protein